MNAIARAQYRRETYAELRSWGEDPECARLRVGVSQRTARRYEARMKQNQQARSEAA